MTLKEYIDKYHGANISLFCRVALTLGVKIPYSTANFWYHSKRKPRKNCGFERIKIATKGKVKPSAFYE